MNKNTQSLHASLFANPDGLSTIDITKSENWKDSELQDSVKLLKQYLQGSGLELIEHNNILQLVAKKTLLFKNLQVKTKTDNLSSSALEVLAIIAYQQPITKDEIANIRGINSDVSIRSLLEKNLIEAQLSKKAGINYSKFYTTITFLQIMGLKSLGDLEPLNNQDVTSS